MTDSIKQAFPDELHLKDVGMRGNSRLFMVEKNDFHFNSSFGVICVPIGFVTDGASIPEIFWSIMGPFGQYFKAALPHDWGYSSLNTTFTKQEVDWFFLEGMKILGVGFFKRYTIYNAVKVFGGFCYKGYKE